MTALRLGLPQISRTTGSDPLFSILAPPSWVGDPEQRCADPRVDPDLFFSDLVADQEKAIKICNSCPLRDRCGAWARQNLERHGVWGGQVFRRSSAARPREVAPPPEDMPTEQLVAAAIGGAGQRFRRLSPSQQRRVVSAMRRDGNTWVSLSRTLKVPMDDLIEIGGRSAVEDRLRALWGHGLTDELIALDLGVGARWVYAARRRLGLPTRSATGRDALTPEQRQAARRELLSQVKALWTDGHSDSEIARRIGRGVSTVFSARRALRLPPRLQPGRPKHTTPSLPPASLLSSCLTTPSKVEVSA